MFTISIITKTYNRLPMLLDCIESVQNLKHEPYEQMIKWEHVIYDDGSHDDTQLHFAKHMYHNTRYIRSDENRGIVISANAAIATCTADYIFELDSDDIIPQRFLTNIYDTTQEYPDSDWFVADFYRMDTNMRYIVGSDYYGWKQYSSCDEILSAIFSNAHFIQHNVVYKKALWERAGRYDETLTMAEDLDLYIRFLLGGHMPKYVPFISHFHRFHEGNASHGVDAERHKEDIAGLSAKYYVRLIERGIPTRSLL